MLTDCFQRQDPSIPMPNLSEFVTTEHIAISPTQEYVPEETAVRYRFWDAAD
jgi:hypothetical protein